MHLPLPARRRLRPIVAPRSPRRRRSSAPQSATPLLDHIGRDLTKLAAEGPARPVIGREEETAWVIETLLRATKRNPVLLGPAGVGKTAIVEGLAQRIAAGRCRTLLKGSRIIEVPLAALVAGTQYRGQLEERVAAARVARRRSPGSSCSSTRSTCSRGPASSEGGMGAAECSSRPWRAATSRSSARRRRGLPDDDRARRGARPAVHDRSRSPSSTGRRRGRSCARPRRESPTTRGVTCPTTRWTSCSTSPTNRSSIAASRTRRSTWSSRPSPRPSSRAARRSIATTRSRPPSCGDARLVDADAGAVRARPGRARAGRQARPDRRPRPRDRRDHRDPAAPDEAQSAAAGPGRFGQDGDRRRARHPASPAGTVPDAAAGRAPVRRAAAALAAGIAADPTLLGDFLAEARHPSVIVFFDEIHLLAAPAVRDLGPGAQAGARPRRDRVHRRHDRGGVPGQPRARRGARAALHPDRRRADGRATAVRACCAAVRDSLSKSRGVTVGDDALDEVIALADQFLPNRSFPDKGVDIIEQSIAYAWRTGDGRDGRRGRARRSSRWSGMPLDPTARLAALRPALTDAACCPSAAAERCSGGWA